MKILIIQLARLGDIYISWPSLRALRRNHPTARIEILTRPKFAEALVGLSGIDQIHHFKSREILEPLIDSDPKIEDSFKILSKEIDELQKNKYDWIINMTFSPVSSFLCHLLGHEQTKINGYTRFSDGYLSIPDDMSAYFYAQVGPDRPNRFHLAEIFSSLCETDLIAEDWREPDGINKLAYDLPENFVCVHVGASESKKRLSGSKWASILTRISHLYSTCFVLIGSSQESEISEMIENSTTAKVINLVGKTKVPELFSILKKSQLLIGCDSAPMHMASLTQTKCLNLSFGVNFWETGPRSPHAFILKGVSDDDFPSDKVAKVAFQILTNANVDLGVITVNKKTPSYHALTSAESDWQWNFVKAIYLGENLPSHFTSLFLQGVDQLRDTNLLILEQLQQVKSGLSLQAVASIIDRAEEVITAIGQIIPDLSILIRWYQTEKIRIGPGNQEQVLQSTIAIHELLNRFLSHEAWRQNAETQI